MTFKAEVGTIDYMDGSAQNNLESVSETNSQVIMAGGKKHDFLMNFLLVLLAVILIGVAGLGVYYFGPFNKVVGVLPGNDQTDSEFISPDDENLLEYGRHYSFKTQVLEVIPPQGDQIELKVALMDEDLPKIILGDRTLLLQSRGNEQPTLGALRNLKAGIKVNIALSFDEKTKEWTTRYVMILDPLPEDSATSTSSTTPNE